jgi:long-chain acyl-CoA synthetase
MAYMAGFYNLILLPFIAGATVVIDEAFSPQKILNFWEVPLKYNVNILWLVPTILSMLMRIDRDERAKEYCEFNIRYVLIGTAPLPTQLRKDFEEKYRVKVYENYGLSETLFVTTNSPNTPVIDGSVGRPLSCSISIIGQEGERLAFGSEGEIMVKTPDLMRGYLDIETGEVKRVNLRELFPTGDIGYLDAEGNLFITGRKKDLIIKGGINISPQAIENVLTEHKAVEQVAVIGIEHPILCEDIAAVVKLKDGYSFEREKSSIIEHCRVNLSQNQQPSTFFEIEEFPLTSTGKIDKKRLKALVSEKMER